MATLATLAVFYAFMLFGLAVLTFFGITLGAFKVMGGLVLFLLGLEMVRSSPGAASHDNTDETASKTTDRPSWNTVAVVPLAMPLIAGPGALSTIVVFTASDDEPGHM